MINLPPVLKIISGGQTGADMGGLMAARELGIETGGTAPQEWWTEEGPREQLLRSYGLVECGELGYPARTWWNVINADGTLLVGFYESGGSALTVAIARELKKPVFHAGYSRGAPMKPDEASRAEFRAWLARHRIRILNVAGNRESTSPGICEFTRAFLFAALR